MEVFILGNDLLAGKVAVITGGAGVLGMAMARTLLQFGCQVMLSDLSQERLEEAIDSLNASEKLSGMVADVTKESDLNELLNATIARYGKLNVWINNAGLTKDATMRKMSVDDFELIIDVHLKGAWLGVRAAAGHMREHGGGSIINVSSISGKVGNPGQTNYSAAKAGMIGLTKAAAKEVGFANVRVNAIQPGLINSPMLDQMPPDVKKSRLSEIPLGRFGEAHEVAQVVAFLASDLSSYMTGAVLEISGGRNL